MRRRPGIRNKSGTTLVEMMVALLLISILLGMAASCLSSAFRVYLRLQKTRYAQSILDTTMTELRNITQNGCEYIKIYGKSPENGGSIENSSGCSIGNTLEFINEEGYVVLVSAEGCEKTAIYIADKKTGEAKAIDAGKLLTRYYFRNSTDGTYPYILEEVPAARAVAEAFGKGFYMGNYLEITYSFPEGIEDGDSLDSILATVTLYSDKERTQAAATDSEILEFRESLIRKDSVTATKKAPSGI